MILLEFWNYWGLGVGGGWPIKLLEYATPPTTPVTYNQSIFLLYFSKHDQLDLLKASNSISYHLTSIFTTLSSPNVPG